MDIKNNSGRKILIVHSEGNVNNNPNLSGLVEILCEHGYWVDIASPRRKAIVQQSPHPKARLLLTENPKGIHGGEFVLLADKPLSQPDEIIRAVHDNVENYDLVIGVDRGIVEAAIIANAKAIPCGLISYEIFFEEETDCDYKRPEILACQDIAFAVCQDPVRAGYLSRENHIPLEKIVHIPVAGRGLVPRQKSYDLHDKLGITRTHKIAICCGSVSPHCMIDELIQSVSFWPQDWVLVIHNRYGLDRKMQSYYQKYLNTRRVYFSTEPVDTPAQMYTLLNSADIGLAFYKPIENNKWQGSNIRHIGFASGKISTYLQHGLPVLINNLELIGDYIRRYNCGYIHSGPMPVLMPFLNNDMYQLSVNAHRLFSEHLDLNKTACSLLERIRGILKPGQPCLDNKCFPQTIRSDDFTFSKQSHFAYFKSKKYDFEYFGREVHPDTCNLKDYQDLLVFAFIKENIPKGSRILDVGGADSRILKNFYKDYECWNIDKLEGIGSGRTSLDPAGRYRLVRDYMGNFNPELPNDYFDFVFSISALEHTPKRDAESLAQIRDDLNRVLKPGGYSLHCFDVVIKPDTVWSNALLPFLFQTQSTLNCFIPLESLRSQSDIFVLSESTYNQRWQKTTQQTYQDFGRPLSYNILWQKASVPTTETKTAVPAPAKRGCSKFPRITVVTPSYNQAAFLEQCIQSVLNQNYPNLEYIIMDGGSTDASVDIIKKYQHRLAYWQSCPDGGQYRAVEAGFNRSTGQIMTWLNSDDVFRSGAFFRVAAVFSGRPEIQWLTGRPNTIHADGSERTVRENIPVWTRLQYLQKQYKKPYIQQEGTFWTRDLWQKAGGCMHSALQMAGDLELWARFFRHAQLYTVDTLLAAFRHQPAQKTKRIIDQYYAEAEQMLDYEILFYNESADKTLLPGPTPISVEELKQLVFTFADAVGSDSQSHTSPALSGAGV